MKLKNPVLLIDGDIVAYRASSATDGREYVIRWEDKGIVYSASEKYKKDADKRVSELEKKGHTPTIELVYNPEPLSHALKIVDDIVLSLETLLVPHIDGTGVRRFFISRNGSFREKEFPPYKSNRIEMRRPVHLEDCKDYLIRKYKAECRPGEYEADDLLAMNQKENTIICSVDKDLLQVPGHHFNWIRNEYSIVSEVEGRRSFYQQILTGDTSDGIPGIPGVGPVTAKKLLKDAESDFLMYCIVLKEYMKRFPIRQGESTEEYYATILSIIRTNARLLYLLRHEKDSWEPPKRGEKDEDISRVPVKTEGIAG